MRDIIMINTIEGRPQIILRVKFLFPVDRGMEKCYYYQDGESRTFPLYGGRYDLY